MIALKSERQLIGEQVAEDGAVLADAEVAAAPLLHQGQLPKHAGDHADRSLAQTWEWGS